MRPVQFPEANANLTKPVGMTDEECGSLPVWRDGKRCISRWKLSWPERFAALFRGHVWLEVWFGWSQPPIALHLYTLFRAPWWIRAMDKCGPLRRWRGRRAVAKVARDAAREMAQKLAGVETRPYG